MRSLALLLLAAGSIGCFPAIKTMTGNVAPRGDSRFLDASTGKELPELLIIPLYHRASGFTADFHDGDGLKFRDSLEKPFVHRPDRRFRLKQPPSAMLVSVVGAAGSHTSINGLLLIAPGYRPRLQVPAKIRHANTPQRFQVWRWKPHADPVEELTLLRELLSRKELGKHELGRWADRPYWEDPLRIDLSAAERRTVDAYLARLIAEETPG